MTTTYEYSRLAMEVYFDDPNLDVGDYTRPVDGTSETISSFTPVTTGFFGAYYKDGAGNIIITYRGTELNDLGDWVAGAD